MIARLKRRRDFLAAARGSRIRRRRFVIEASHRGDDGPPRCGFTVTKRTAVKAVERNRIRRRLREAARLALAAAAEPGVDYVIIGRREALGGSFSRMSAEIAEAALSLRRPIKTAAGEQGASP